MPVLFYPLINTRIFCNVGGFTSFGSGEKKELLDAIGVTSFDALLAGIPGPLCCDAQINLPSGISEVEAMRHLSNLAAKNASGETWNAFLGAGIYDHFVPSATAAIVSRSEFLTAYTPYQAEVSQGTLQSIYEYQSCICELTGMEVSNASMYDGATALAEAVFMAQSIERRGSKVIVPASLNPFYRQVLKTYLKGLNIEILEAGLTSSGTLDLDQVKKLLGPEVFGVVVQSPNFFGIVEDIAALASLKKEHKFTLIAVPNLVGLAILEAPGKLGADICAGEAHYLASGPSFGGPLLGFMATKIDHIRQMPGRIVGRTVDKEGRMGFVLTAQTREQHIRREKATSNICSNEGLLALSATITLSLLGKEGFVQMAELNVNKTQYALSKLRKAKKAILPFSGPVFNEFVVEVKGESLDSLFERAKAGCILPGIRLDKLENGASSRILVCITEKKTKEDIDALIALFE